MSHLDSATKRLVNALIRATSRLNSDPPASEPSGDCSPSKEPDADGRFSKTAKDNHPSSKAMVSTYRKELSQLIGLLLNGRMNRNPSATSSEVRQKLWGRLLVPILAMVVVGASWWHYWSY
ncbi:hypothetical protein E2C01_024286 [Portunus trituberculatus]|uniref:Uncharacterized protein n=1 Tax=Portunus trituberculatus TaxID=210409 RepID=A0A5B7EA78_PORTR|nr:hypothetical protein [Portunus trituberculatus]